MVRIHLPPAASSCEPEYRGQTRLPRSVPAAALPEGCLPAAVFFHSKKLSTGTRQRRCRNASRNAGLVSMPSALALMFANPTLMSLAQNGTRPQRMTSRLRWRSLALHKCNS